MGVLIGRSLLFGIYIRVITARRSENPDKNQTTIIAVGFGIIQDLYHQQ